jgi:hypothetical protein
MTTRISDSSSVFLRRSAWRRGRLAADEPLARLRKPQQSFKAAETEKQFVEYLQVDAGKQPADRAHTDPNEDGLERLPVLNEFGKKTPSCGPKYRTDDCGKERPDGQGKSNDFQWA